MCRRFTLTTQRKTAFSALKGYEGGFYEETVVPKRRALCLRKEEGSYSIFYPSFGYPLFEKEVVNARIETIEEKSLFRDDYKNRRLLVPVSGFFEYDKEKKLHYFTEEKNKLFYLAGIYHNNNFVILTEKPSLLVYACHPRRTRCFAKKDKDLFLSLTKKKEDWLGREKVTLVDHNQEQLSLFQ